MLAESGQVRKTGKNFSGFREAVFRLFGKDQFVIGNNLKDTTARGNEFGFDAQFFFDLCRQTDGLGFVVSDLAILDGDLHVGLSGHDACLELDQWFGPPGQSLFK